MQLMNHPSIAIFHSLWCYDKETLMLMPQLVMTLCLRADCPMLQRWRAKCISWQKQARINIQEIRTRWWFQRFWMFIPIWGRLTSWLIFFRWFETANSRMFGADHKISDPFSIDLHSLWSDEKSMNARTKTGVPGIIYIPPWGNDVSAWRLRITSRV